MTLPTLLATPGLPSVAKTAFTRLCLMHDRQLNSRSPAPQPTGTGSFCTRLRFAEPPHRAGKGLFLSLGSLAWHPKENCSDKKKIKILRIFIKNKDFKIFWHNSKGDYAKSGEKNLFIKGASLEFSTPFKPL